MNAVSTPDGISDPSRVVTDGQAPVLSLRGISKSYSGIRALSSVDLEVHAGEGPNPGV